MKKKLSLLVLALVALSQWQCGEESKTRVDVKDVLGIPKGNKEGSGLTGAFTVLYEITDDGCKAFPVLEIPARGTTAVIEMDVEQEEGTLAFKDLIATLRGGINFDNSYKVGGTQTLDRGGIANVLSAILLNGKFEDPNSLTGTGWQRFVGRIATTEIDCTVGFKVSGIRR